MSVKYVLVERRNPQHPESPTKWYACAKSKGEVSLRDLGKEITQRSTVNHADTLAVLEALTQVLTLQLSEGNIVRFGDFGSFQISLGGSGSETKEQYTHALIQSKKVVFRPGIDLKEMLNNLKYEKA
ncbi:MAG: HU family DNA-binding protein [Dysgonamonadaceae bacterium]|jgi:predicted histone-like DNA-binding protein|nr:HU family DNA-binding protein [Dysgonamonadaceae bacterium]